MASHRGPLRGKGLGMPDSNHRIARRFSERPPAGASLRGGIDRALASPPCSSRVERVALTAEWMPPMSQIDARSSPSRCCYWLPWRWPSSPQLPPALPSPEWKCSSAATATSASRRRSATPTHPNTRTDLRHFEELRRPRIRRLPDGAASKSAAMRHQPACHRRSAESGPALLRIGRSHGHLAALSHGR
jgi:hypothetical protein